MFGTASRHNDVRSRVTLKWKNGAYVILPISNPNDMENLLIQYGAPDEITVSIAMPTIIPGPDPKYTYKRLVTAVTIHPCG